MSILKSEIKLFKISQKLSELLVKILFYHIYFQIHHLNLVQFVPYLW
jgi:hypothetical protein